MNACDPRERACCASSRRFEPWLPWELRLLKFIIIIIIIIRGDCGSERVKADLHGGVVVQGRHKEVTAEGGRVGGQEVVGAHGLGRVHDVHTRREGSVVDGVHRDVGGSVHVHRLKEQVSAWAVNRSIADWKS